MQVQLAIDMKTRVCTVVQQQIGQVAQTARPLPFSEDFQPGQPLSFRMRLGAANTCVAMDNVRITRGSASRLDR